MPTEIEVIVLGSFVLFRVMVRIVARGMHKPAVFLILCVWVCKLGALFSLNNYLYLKALEHDYEQAETGRVLTL